jgi:hypothetical protein
VSRFQVDVAPDFAAEFEATIGDTLGWQLHGSRLITDRHGYDVRRYDVESAQAPARAEGKLISPVFQRDDDGEINVINWGIPAAGRDGGQTT